MNDSELKSGCVYRLANNVQNPKVDRRGHNFRNTGFVSYEWVDKMPTWPLGMRFRYVERDEDLAGITIKLRHIENFDGSSHRHISPTIINPDWSGDKDDKRPRSIPNPKWSALVSALVPEPESFDTFFAELDPEYAMARRHADDLLEVLYNTGKVSKDDIRGAWKLYQERER